MTNIQITTQTFQAIEPFEGVQRLSESQIEIVRATQDKRIAELSHAEINKLAGEVIFTAKTRLGHSQAKGEELKAEITLISSDLRSFKGLTGREVHLALKSALNGDFSSDGKIFFSSSNFVQWLKKWIAEKKQPTMKQYTALEQAKESVKLPPSEEEYKLLVVQIANQYAEVKSKHSDFEVQVASSLYDDLERFEIWSMPSSQKRELFEELQVKNPTLSKEQLVNIAKNKAYNVFIQMLSLENKRVKSSGEIEGK